MNFPKELKYTQEHEWVKVDGTTATCGITEFAQSELGDVVFVDLPTTGKSVKQKDSICVVESTKAASDVYAPISGTVKESNVSLTTEPQLINSDPYGKGWMVKLDGITSAELSNLMSADQYAKFVEGKEH